MTTHDDPLQKVIGAFIAVSEVARRLSVSANMVRKWIDDGRLACVWANGQRLCHPDAVEDFKIEREVSQLLKPRRKPGPRKRITNLTQLEGGQPYALPA